MTVEDKEFIVFVGPSGCGKSTTLRMIAGLEDISSGEIYIDGRLVNDMEPKDRDIAMVFQNYALYPHISVYENMAFGLKIRKIPSEEIHRRVMEAAEILGITEYLDRKPRAMSGGQRQRVALGRAIVREPKVFLFDEPLSNLDAKLRTQMRAEIRKLHARLKTTFIYVTHDQTEAMTMGTRIVVMRDGVVQQIDTPKNLYYHSRNRFVAGFIGTPPMNFFRVRLDAGGTVTVKGTSARFKCPESRLRKMDPSVRSGEKECILGIRAEKIRLIPSGADCGVNCIVTHTEELGDETLVYGDLSEAPDPMMANGTEIVFRIYGEGVLIPEGGQHVQIEADLEDAHFFDVESGETVCPAVPKSNVLTVSVCGKTAQWCHIRLTLPSAIDLPDGMYRAVVPTDAIERKNGSEGKVVAIETYGDTRLSLLSFGGQTVFAIGSFGAVGESCGIQPDFRRIIWQRGEETVLFPLKDEVELNARVVRKKSPQGIKYLLSIGEETFPMPPSVLSCMIRSAGTSLLKKPLVCRIPADAWHTSERGIRALVLDSLDYGTHRYVRVEMDGKSFPIKTDARMEGRVCFAPDLLRVTVVDRETDVVLYP